MDKLRTKFKIKQFVFTTELLRGINKSGSLFMTMLLRPLLIFCLLMPALSLADVNRNNGFSNKDISPYDSLAQEFTSRNTGLVDFSIPAGSYRASCERCEYDTKVLRCYCLDVTQRISYFPNDYPVGNCKSIANQGGNLVCTDYEDDRLKNYHQRYPFTENENNTRYQDSYVKDNTIEANVPLITPSK